MKQGFANTKNVQRFVAAISALERRGAPEAALLLLTGEAGHGKTQCAQWFASQHEGVYLRAKAAMTPHWLMSDLVGELGIAPSRSTEAMFQDAVRALATTRRPIVLDEVEHALHDSKCIETLRDISDLLMEPVILVGMDGVDRRLKRLGQLYSRITQTVVFQALSAEDIDDLIAQKAEVPVAAGVGAVVAKATGGFIREIMDAIAEIERIGARLGRPVEPKDLDGARLTGGRTARAPRTPPGGRR